VLQIGFVTLHFFIDITLSIVTPRGIFIYFLDSASFYSNVVKNVK